MKTKANFLRIAFRTGLQGEMVFRSNFFMEIFRIFLRALLLFALWTALYSGKASIDGINLNTMIFYALLSIVFEIFISAKIETGISSDISSGNIALRMARPVRYPVVLILDQISYTGVNLALRLIPYSLILIAISLVMKPDVSISFVFIVSTILSYILFSLYQMVFGFISFWTMEISGVIEARDAAMLVFSGSLIPLWFFPEWLFNISKFLPFQAIFHTPLSIAIKKLAGAKAWEAVLVQGIWVLAFILLNLLAWSRAKRRVVVNIA